MYTTTTVTNLIFQFKKCQISAIQLVLKQLFCHILKNPSQKWCVIEMHKTCQNYAKKRKKAVRTLLLFKKIIKAAN